MRLSACLWYQGFEFSLFQNQGNGAARIVKVAKIHALGGANTHACRVHSLFHPVVKAKGTLIHIAIWMRKTGIVRAGCDTSPAANAVELFYKYRTPIAVMTGASRTATHAGCIFTMVATLRANLNFQLRVSAIGHFNDPVAAIANGHIIFGLAGNHTVAATHAFFGIYSHCIPHASTSSFSKTNVTKLLLMPVPPITGSILTLVTSSVSLIPLPWARVIFLLSCPKPCTM
jgi:hypothetical protein